MPQASAHRPSGGPHMGGPSSPGGNRPSGSGGGGVWTHNGGGGGGGRGAASMALFGPKGVSTRPAVVSKPVIVGGKKPKALWQYTDEEIAQLTEEQLAYLQSSSAFLAGV